MGSIKNLFNNVTIKYKLLSIILLNVIIILICSIGGYVFCTRVYNNLLFKAIAGNLSVSSYSISENLQNIETLSSIIISSSPVQEELEALKNSTDAIVRSNANKRLNTTLMNHYSLFKSSGVAYIVIYNHQFSNCTNWALLSKTDPEMIRIAQENAVTNGGAVTWNYRGNSDYLMLTRNVLKIDNLDFSPLGNILIAVDLDKVVTDSNQAVTLYNDSKYIITDQDNQILYASQSLSDTDAEYFLKESNQPFQLLSAGGHTYFSVIGTLPRYDYKYISLIPFDSIENSLKLTLSIMVIGLILGFLIIIFLSCCIVHYIVNQFNSLINKMQSFQEDSLAPPAAENEYSKRNDELGKLHQHFDEMANRIWTLVKVNYVNEILTKDARLKALETQINPHFLYNTLESINSIAKMNGNTTITQMVSSLGNLLHSTLSQKDSLVSLSYELKLLESYMTIQKVRFEDRLVYEIHADPTLMDADIPQLTIQPLVENAIHYGMEEMTEECHIYVEVYKNNGLVTIQVKNEGSCFEQDLLEKLRIQKKTPNGFGIGLLNINQRIELLFGDTYGLTLFNQASYAVAQIVIPYKTGGRKNVQTDNC